MRPRAAVYASSSDDCRARAGRPGWGSHRGSGGGCVGRNGSARRRDSARDWAASGRQSGVGIGRAVLYVTYSGARGRELPFSIFRRVSPTGRRESYSMGIMESDVDDIRCVGGTAVCVEPIRRVNLAAYFPTARTSRICSNIGIACGLAFDRKGVLYVGDQSGTVFAVQPDRTVHRRSRPCRRASRPACRCGAGRLCVRVRLRRWARTDHVYLV